MRELSSDPAVASWFRGRSACVLGLGRSGAAAASLLHRLGARVGVTESRPRREVRDWLNKLPPRTVVETGSHRLLKRPWDYIVTSPGVPREVWEPLAERGMPVWGELELGYRVLALAGRWPRRNAAVTGTNGKTTTTALLGEMLRADGLKTVVAGNIGTPLCAVAATLTAEHGLALEVSSYQLESADAFRPAAGTVLNLTPDHLKRHKTMANYAAAKFRLFQNFSREGVAVLNAADPWCRRLARSVPGRVEWFGRGGAFTFDEDGLSARWDGRRFSWPAPRFLRGRHNFENAAAAAACALALGVRPAAIGRALATFRGVEHRLEEVRRWRGVAFVNDSKATNVDSTVVALKAFPGRLRVILGGEDKGSPYAPLRSLLKAKAKEVLLIGEAAPKIERELSGAAPLARCGTLERAVARAAKQAAAGDVVLLSPACASFDQFDNFEHRGRRFREIVEAL